MNWQGRKFGSGKRIQHDRIPQSPSPGWFQRYAGSLLLSIVGSIMSAFTGYAIRELPKKIAARTRLTRPRLNPGCRWPGRLVVGRSARALQATTTDDT